MMKAPLNWSPDCSARCASFAKRRILRWKRRTEDFSRVVRGAGRLGSIVSRSFSSCFSNSSAVAVPRSVSERLGASRSADKTVTGKIWKADVNTERVERVEGVEGVEHECNVNLMWMWCDWSWAHDARMVGLVKLGHRLTLRNPNVKILSRYQSQDPSWGENFTWNVSTDLLGLLTCHHACFDEQLGCMRQAWVT